MTIVTSGTDGFVYVHEGLFLIQHTKQICVPLIINNIHTCSYVGDQAERGGVSQGTPLIQ